MAWAKVKTALLILAVPILAIPVAAVCFARDNAVEVPAVSFFGPGRGYDRSQCWSVRGPSSPLKPEYCGHGEWFVATVSGPLSSIELAISRFGEGRVNVFIAADNNGFPGEVLERFTNQLPPRLFTPEKVAQILEVRHKMLPPTQFEFTEKTGFWKLNSHSHPTLRGGSKYWICAEAAESSTEEYWFQTNLRTTNIVAESYSRSAWELKDPVALTLYKGAKNPNAPSHNGAFRVNVKQPLAQVAVNK